MRAALAVLAALAVAGCRAAAEGEPAAPSAAAAPPSADARDVYFTGRIVPADPLLLHAPPNTFKIYGWSSASDTIQIVEIVEDGAKVAAGDVVARFAFRADSVLPRVEQRVRGARASLEAARTAEDERLRDLVHAAERARMAADRAEVDLARRAALSAREGRRIEIDARIARFEADAAQRRVEAQIRRRAAAIAHEERLVALRELDLKIFDAYRERFLTRAPAAGVLRHAWLTRRKRRVQKGDELPGGTHFASVARDERLSVRFFLPEARLADAVVGRGVRVRPPGDAAAQHEARGRIARVEPFPQPLGFLEDDWELTSALERFYVVQAELDGSPPFPAGIEAEVRL